MLLFDDPVDTLKITLNLSFRSELRDLTSRSHFLDIRFEFADGRTWNLFVFDVSLFVDGSFGSVGILNVFVDGSCVQHFATIFDQHIGEFFSKLISLTTFGRTMIDVILHEFKKSR